jgi:peptidoglycan-associated lipoprotein
MRPSMKRQILWSSCALLFTVGCHRTSPAPSPATTVSAPNADSLRLARARADSIARADARRRDSIAAANAREDSLRRATDAQRAIAAARAALVEPVHFDFDRSDLRSGDRSLLERKAEIMSVNRAVQIRIEGNTDDRGSDEYNLALGMRRAAEVRRFLISLGIDSSRVSASSNGEERPACREPDESCWSRNRRAEFVILAGGDRIIAARP